MKKLILSTIFMVFSLIVSAYDIAVANNDGVTIYYNYYKNTTELEVTYYSTSNNLYSGVVNVPEEVTYMGRTRKVTSIGYQAFAYSYGLISVTIPNSVTSIGNYVFEDCSGLTSVTIGNSVARIGYYAFHGCTNLTSVHIMDTEAWCKILFDNNFSNPLYLAHRLYLNGEEIKDLVIPNSVTSISDMAFDGCTGLTSVTIPNSVTSIGDMAFYGCSGLTSVTIGNSVTSIGAGAFDGCTGLTSVAIPNSVTSIGLGAFYGCSGLTSVTIGNSVTTIGDGAFSSCSSLTSVTIPNSVTSIGEYAFSNCNGLTYVISKMDNPCSIYDNCFSNDVYYNVTLYVPQGTMGKYKSTNYWNKFLFIEEDVTDISHNLYNPKDIQVYGGIISVSGLADGQQIAIYQVDGKQVATAKAHNGTACVATNISKGTPVIVKIGDKAVKVMMR